MADPASEWGLPDWRVVADYGDTSKWGFMKWRWEFYRRREDLRDAFDKRAPDTYRHYREIHGENNCLRPDQPGFTAQSYLDDGFGYAGIPNPRISNQTDRVMFSSLDYPGGHVFFNHGLQKDVNGGPCLTQVDDHQMAAVFDLTKPLAEQMAATKRHFEYLQEKTQGKKIQKRRHQDKWLTYLRVLDGRECGASWSEIARILSNTAQTEQTARDAWEQARALCFNF